MDQYERSEAVKAALAAALKTEAPGILGKPQAPSTVTPAAKAVVPVTSDAPISSVFKSLDDARLAREDADRAQAILAKMEQDRLAGDPDALHARVDALADRMTLDEQLVAKTYIDLRQFDHANKFISEPEQYLRNNN